MKEKQLREALKTALNGISEEKQEEVSENWVPQNKEHLKEAREIVNESLMKRWGFSKKNK